APSGVTESSKPQLRTLMARGIDTQALYDRHCDPLLRYFARRTADPQVALDLWAETFAQVVASARRYRGATADDEAAWLYAIARNQLAGYLRKGYAEQRMVRKLGIERPPVDDALLADVDRRAGLAEVRSELSAALATLTDDTRQAVTLRVVHELPYPQVADRLAITEVAARARVSRGLQSLARILDPELANEVSA
ncbi:MAG: RNA polymerase sigma factor, partial [Solirubrobacteraceae bacterium]|nr:RNA polymerase sigma factor [Solirubrobacteraceae bacterium]